MRYGPDKVRVLNCMRCLQKENKVSRRLQALVVLLLIIALCVWASFRSREHHHLSSTKDAAKAKINPSSQGPQADDLANLISVDFRGKPAPDFTLNDTRGRPVSLAEYKGHPIIVNFWATDCEPCKLEMPWFEQLQEKYKSQGLVILGIDQDQGLAQKKVATAARKLGISYPILLPNDAIAKKYGGVDYLPETFYVGRNGHVLIQTAGAPTKDEIEANIRKTFASGA
jgi:thiol-disulfide isomerase/thioredoxin